MKKNLILILISLSILLQFSCSENDLNTEPTNPDITLANEINDFVWKGMNNVYYWQKDVQNLSDTKNDDLNTYYEYLNGYSDPEELFKSLRYNYGVTDRFSWYIDDYKVQDASFRGVTDSFGFEFGLSRLCANCDEVIGYVQYVVPNSPAADANIKRGDVFYKFNDVVLDINNYTVINKYYSDNSIRMGFATLENGTITPNNVSADLTIREVVENPVFYSDVITNDQGKKIGYLVYNGFKYTFHEELNNIFAQYKNENIDELVLDLRYNGGGTLLTTAYLASMIHAGAADGEVFAKLTHNTKLTQENSFYSFYDKASVFNKDGDYTAEKNINRVTGLTRMFVITSGNTASASEMIISGLTPFMQVIKVGTTTYGKNVGSYTVYDSPDFSSNNINSNHTVAMQPITFKVFNKLDQSDYTHGFSPDYEQIEYVSDMKQFGDLEEPLLNICLNIISGNVAKAINLKSPELETENIFNSMDKKPFSKEMYILNQ